MRRAEPAPRRFAGPFSVSRDRGTLIVASADGHGLFFNQAAGADPPAAGADLTVRELGPAAPGSRRFELSTAGWSETLVARSLQIHERADLYGKVIALPRFELRRRLLWSILLRLARYRTGQALIRRVTGRSSEPSAAAPPDP
jgi:hypothetical protein